MEQQNTFRSGPDESGHFGIFGGRFVAETLMPLILEVEKAYGAARQDPSFQAEIDYYLKHYVGRPSPPASIQGRDHVRPASRRHSKLRALPPGSAVVMLFGGFASNSSQSATAR